MKKLLSCVSVITMLLSVAPAALAEEVKSSAPAVTVGVGETIIEFEAYKDYVFSDETTSVPCETNTYDKGTVLNVTEKPANESASITIPFTVEITGTYEISLIANWHIGEQNSPTSFSLDGAILCTNDPDTLLTGTMVVAFYKGTDLVGLYTDEAILNNILTADAIPCTDKPDKVKFFVFEDMKSLKTAMMNPVLINNVK